MVDKVGIIEFYDFNEQLKKRAGKPFYIPEQEEPLKYKSEETTHALVAAERNIRSVAWGSNNLHFKGGCIYPIGTNKMRLLGILTYENNSY